MWIDSRMTYDDASRVVHGAPSTPNCDKFETPSLKNSSPVIIILRWYTGLGMEKSNFYLICLRVFGWAVTYGDDFVSASTVKADGFSPLSILMET